MIYEIHMTPEAKGDLASIFRYIAYTLQSLQNAVRQLDRLEKSIVSLNQMPERFRIYEKEPWRSRNLRVMTVGHYLVFYISNHDEGKVTILRVLYGGRDIDRQLKESE